MNSHSHSLLITIPSQSHTCPGRACSFIHFVLETRTRAKHHPQPPSPSICALLMSQCHAVSVSVNDQNMISEGCLVLQETTTLFAALNLDEQVCGCHLSVCSSATPPDTHSHSMRLLRPCCKEEALPRPRFSCPDGATPPTAGDDDREAHAHTRSWCLPGQGRARLCLPFRGWKVPVHG